MFIKVKKKKIKTPKLNNIHPRNFFLLEIMYKPDYPTFSETGGVLKKHFKYKLHVIPRNNTS